MSDIQPTPMCKYCTNHKLSPSQPRGLRDWFMRALSRKPMRCHNCSKRFYVAASKLPAASTATPPRP